MANLKRFNFVPVDDVIAANVRARREELHLTQGDLAELMRACDWTPATVTQLESGRRRLSAAEAVALAYETGTSLVDLLVGGDDSKEMLKPGRSASATTAYTRSSLRECLADPAAFPGGAAMDLTFPPDDDERPLRDEERKLATRLSMPAPALRRMVRDTYGCSLAEERDKRIPDRDELSPRSLQAKRGRAMREIEKDLRGRERAGIATGKKGRSKR